jgi:hypothetical protein
VGKHLSVPDRASRFNAPSHFRARFFESAIASRLERVLPKEPSFARARFEPLHLLHREEGIDLRLSLAAMPPKRRCREMPPTPVSSV